MEDNQVSSQRRRNTVLSHEYDVIWHLEHDLTPLEEARYQARRYAERELVRAINPVKIAECEAFAQIRERSMEQERPTISGLLTAIVLMGFVVAAASSILLLINRL